MENKKTSYPRTIRYHRDHLRLDFDCNDMVFKDNNDGEVTSVSDTLRYIKGVISSSGQFEDRIINKVRKLIRGEVVDVIDEYYNEIPKDADESKFTKHTTEEGQVYYTEVLYMKDEPMDDKPETRFFEDDSIIDLFEGMLEAFDDAVPFSYAEAMAIEEEGFRAKVFSSINVPTMMKELGAERIATKGQAVKHKQYDNDGNCTGEEEYDVVYELLKIDGNAIGAGDEPIYAVRCWCTSTDEEHVLWVDGDHGGDPLKAIASTFVVHENLIPHIKELKRQGDVLFAELNDGAPDPMGPEVSLTTDQYFGLLTAQS